MLMAVSGGGDSVALLWLLKKFWDGQIVAAHLSMVSAVTIPKAMRGLLPSFALNGMCRLSWSPSRARASVLARGSKRRPEEYATISEKGDEGDGCSMGGSGAHQGRFSGDRFV